MEMYLKALLVLEERQDVVRAKDLAAELDLSRPSVTRAVATLVKLGHVTHEPYQQLALTSRGRQIARAVLHRHQVLRTFLIEVLGVAAGDADEDACALEHVVSTTTLRRLTDFLSFLHECPRAPRDVVRHFQEIAACRTAPCCNECGLQKLPAPALTEPLVAVARQHSRF
jgi:DtxR family Mn-dependent transcriptional regulator